jgi:tyrosinase
MSDVVADSSPISRRDVILGTAALATATSLPVSVGDIPAGAICTAAVATAVSAPRVAAAAGRARYRRWNLSASDCPPRVLDSYKRAISAMLALPPTDPRNWYRYALLHTLDCPHGNWWLLPWHRGYIGWFERICRELSGDSQFALPYWDWTQEPRVPRAMFEDVLDPNDSAFIEAAEAFKAKFKDPIAKAGYWTIAKSPDGGPDPSPQYGQLLRRSVRFPDDLWFDVIDSPMGPMFFDRPRARGLSAAHPELTIPDAPPDKQAVLVAVSRATILDALAPRDFVSFAGAKAAELGSATGFGVLESQPHNLVHNCVGGMYNDVGGFMQANMSPVDPIFYLHHANVDRLWDVWTRKQLAKNHPILPDGYPAAAGQAPRKGSDYAKWAAEPFVFFVDTKGNPVQQNTAGAYADIGVFDYDYSPGSGEEVVPPNPPPLLLSQLLQKPLLADLNSRRIAGGNLAEGSVAVPLSLVQQQAQPHQPKLFASVTVDLLPQGHEDLDVFVDRADGSPQFVATLSMFGHRLMRGPVTFLVPLSAALETLQTNQRFGASPTLKFSVAPRARGGAAAAMAAQMRSAVTPVGTGEVTAISLQQL